MSREIRRVPMDFSFPLNKTWTGYLWPPELHEAFCPDCGGSGKTPSRMWIEVLCRRMEDVAHDIADQRRGRAMHPYLAEFTGAPDESDLPVWMGERKKKKDQGLPLWWETPEVLRPSEDILPLMAPLTGYSEERLAGPMCGNSWQVDRKLIEAAGLDPEVWGWCVTCKATGGLEKYEGQRKDQEAWERTEPPEGDGWQLWQTVSEGGPISPVFATPEELAEWMSSPAYTWGASKHSTLSYEGALAVVQAGWAFSGAETVAHGVETGEEFAARTALEREV